jgi:hypothetical protein
MAKQRSVSFDDAKTNSRSEKVKVTDLVSLLKLPEKKWVTGRLFGGLNSYATGWVNYKKKDGGGKGKFPVNLRSWDPQSGSFDSTVYDPWFALWQKEKDEGIAKEKMTIQINKKFYADFLLRSAQRQAPSTLTKPTRAERESGFKDKDSDTWTPWTVFAMPPSLVEKVKELKGLNVVRSKKSGSKAYSVADEAYGCDVRIYYDGEKSPADQYQIQLGERTPLDEEELAFLRYDTSNLVTEQTDEEVKRDFESFCTRAGIELDEPKRKRSKKREDDEDEDDQPKRSKRRSSDDDEDDEDEDDRPKRSKRRADPDEDDEDETPKKRGKASRDDDDDLDEDDEPPKKRGSKSSKDEDDDDQDDDDDEPRRGKGKTGTGVASSAKSRSKRAVEEDEDDGDDDSDGDEDDEGVSAKSKSSKKRRPDPDEDEDDEDEPPKKRGKKVVEEDDDLDDEDEPPKKRGKKVVDEDDDEPSPKRSSKKRPDPDEDEDDEPAPKRSAKRKPARDEDDDDLDD